MWQRKVLKPFSIYSLYIVYIYAANKKKKKIQYIFRYTHYICLTLIVSLKKQFFFPLSCMTKKKKLNIVEKSPAATKETQKKNIYKCDETESY